MAGRIVSHLRSIDLRGAVVVITGGSRGLGLEMARVFAAEGGRLVLLARDAAELDRARNHLASLRYQVDVRVCDVGDRAQVEATIGEIERSMGRIDILVNNAGVILSSPWENLTEHDFAEALNVHLWGPMHLTRAVAPGMRRRGAGRIVNIASIAGLVSIPHLLPYSASKFALVGFSQGVGAELSRWGIRVTTVCPGLMRTGSHLNAWFKGRHRAEFALFAILGALPVSSIDAARAARRIVTACRRGESFLVLSPHARALRWAAALAPSVVANALALAARFLPPADGGDGDRRRRGRDCGSRLAPSILTRLSDKAAVRNLETPEPRIGDGESPE